VISIQISQKPSRYAQIVHKMAAHAKEIARIDDKYAMHIIPLYCDNLVISKAENIGSASVE
jgi:hypothetical protein